MSQSLLKKPIDQTSFMVFLLSAAIGSVQVRQPNMLSWGRCGIQNGRTKKIRSS